MKSLIKIMLIIFMLLPVTVSYAGDVCFTLQWDPPTTNVDGSVCNDLDHYIVYWGASSGQYNNSSAPIAHPTTSYSSCFPPGKYYFVVTAVDTSNNESPYSNEVIKDLLDNVSCQGPVNLR
jgi:nitrogen fixation-related uncharacterized protein